MIVCRAFNCDCLQSLMIDWWLSAELLRSSSIWLLDTATLGVVWQLTDGFNNSLTAFDTYNLVWHSWKQYLKTMHIADILTILTFWLQCTIVTLWRFFNVGLRIHIKPVNNCLWKFYRNQQYMLLLLSLWIAWCIHSHAGEWMHMFKILHASYEHKKCMYLQNLMQA